MYLDHFGLSEVPFRITPNTEFFFTGANRGATLDALVYAIINDEGIVKVSGEVGSGKTMLCRMLRERRTVAHALAAQSRVLGRAEDLAAEEEVGGEEDHAWIAPACASPGSPAATSGRRRSSAVGLSSCSTSVSNDSRARTTCARAPDTSTSAGSGDEL